MNNNRIPSIAIAILGVVAGVLGTMVVDRCRPSEHQTKNYSEWRKLNLILECASDNYVDTIDVAAVTGAAASAALSKLDPHSVYMPPEELEESEVQLEGNFQGIGIQFNVPDDTAIVLEVIPGGPSEKIGIRQGDRILKVDDKVIAGVKCPQDSMVRRMKGPAGTKVTVTVLREREEIPFEITRDHIPVNSVDASFMINDTIGYIRLAKFTRTTTREFVAAAGELVSSGMTGLIFDIRGNSGGYLDQALNLSNAFLPKDACIVYVEGLHRKREDYKADGRGFLKDIALTVLIDEGSASSSEIFAGAIQDNDRGVVIGRRSFGKGLVQEPFNFTDKSGIRLTVARFYTPSGRCIQKPYSADYQYDIINRYRDGELVDADSIKVNTELEFFTAGGRKVYGGGGIVPDVFVPIDTSRVTDFYMALTRKATSMRFASRFFDLHKKELGSIGEYGRLLAYLDSAGLEQGFLSFASEVDGLRPSSRLEWEKTSPYLMPQVRALVGRYSKLGEKAFYHLYLDTDNMIEVALQPHPIELPR